MADHRIGCLGLAQTRPMLEDDCPTVLMSGGTFSFPVSYSSTQSAMGSQDPLLQRLAIGLVSFLEFALHPFEGRFSFPFGGRPESP